MCYIRRLYVLICTVIVAVGCLLGTLPANAEPGETGFLQTKKAASLYMNTRQLDIDYDGEALSFVMDNDGQLYLLSRNGKHVYMTFSGYYGNNIGIGYSIRPIHTMFPSMTFYEIIADQGAHGKNCGYWLIGKRDGKWVTYISIDNLAAMGYTANKWHQISTEANADATGRFILTSSHEYMPPGAIDEAHRKHAVDLRLQIFWDKEARWFGMKCL